MYNMYANLHFHSTHSDGQFTPEELVKIAKEEGYKALALTDHDTATGNAEMAKLCEREGLEYIVGAEFYAEGLGFHFHIVGLDFDMEHPKMKEHLDYTSKMCIYRTKGLFEMGLARGTLKDITWEEVVENWPGVRFLCVDHVFLTMKKKGVITDAEYKTFHRNNFSQLIPFENIYKYRSIEQVIDIINSAGGIAILAHPCWKSPNQFSVVPDLVKMGLKGIETWHRDHTDEEAAEAERLAKEYNLYESGGTDHGGLMGGQYKFYANLPVEENPFYVPSLKFGVSEENFRKIKNRVLG